MTAGENVRKREACVLAMAEGGGAYMRAVASQHKEGACVRPMAEAGGVALLIKAMVIVANQQLVAGGLQLRFG